MRDSLGKRGEALYEAVMAAMGGRYLSAQKSVRGKLRGVTPLPAGTVRGLGTVGVPARGLSWSSFRLGRKSTQCVSAYWLSGVFSSPSPLTKATLTALPSFFS